MPLTSTRRPSFDPSKFHAGPAEFIINNAEELFQALSHYSARQRKEMLADNQDRFTVSEKTLSDGSKVFDFSFRVATPAQRKAEAE